MEPRRIQLSRRKGYKKPAGAVVVSRPSKWGNPFKLDGTWQEAFRALALGERGNEAGRRAAAVKLFEMWLTTDYRASVNLDGEQDTRTPWEREVMTLPAVPPPPSLDEIRRELAGKDLACWCPIGQACHADVLLRIANERAKATEQPDAGEGEG